MTNQRKHLIDTVNALIDADELLFCAGLNIEMGGDMLEVSHSFEVGDAYSFDISLLETSKDETVQKIADLLSQMTELRDSLLNVHLITDEELDQVRQENEDYDNQEDEWLKDFGDEEFNL